MFKAIDVDNSGCITVDELREGLRKKGAELAMPEVGDCQLAPSLPCPPLTLLLLPTLLPLKAESSFLSCPVSHLFRRWRTLFAGSM